MALRFIEGFDHWTTNAEAVSGKWSAYGNAVPTISGTLGRFTTEALRLSDVRQGLGRFFDYRDTWIVGCAVYFEGFTSNSPSWIFSFTQDGTNHMELVCDSNGFLIARRNTTTLGTAASALPVATWVYIEMKTFINDTTGTVEVRVNSVPVINLTNVDTRNGASALVNRIAISGRDPGFSNCIVRYDDFYVCDTSGAAPSNDFLGDVRVETLMPNGNGTTSEFDGSDGNSIDNYLLVDEATPDDDTTYVTTTIVGEKDTYAHENLATTSGTVYGVQITPRFRKADAGSRTAVSVARLGVTEADSPSKIVFDSYTYDSDVRETKPGGGAWTLTDVNSAEFGVKVNS